MKQKTVNSIILKCHIENDLMFIFYCMWEVLEISLYKFPYC